MSIRFYFLFLFAMFFTHCNSQIIFFFHNFSFYFNVQWRARVRDVRRSSQIYFNNRITIEFVLSAYIDLVFLAKHRITIIILVFKCNANDFRDKTLEIIILVIRCLNSVLIRTKPFWDTSPEYDVVLLIFTI